jgi:hypothetical protein
MVNAVTGVHIAAFMAHCLHIMAGVTFVFHRMHFMLFVLHGSVFVHCFPFVP